MAMECGLTHTNRPIIMNHFMGQSKRLQPKEGPEEPLAYDGTLSAECTEKLRVHVELLGELSNRPSITRSRS